MTAVAEPPLEIVAHAEPVNIGGVVVYVGRLSIRKVLALGRALAGPVSAIPAEELRDAANGGWSAVLALMSDDVFGTVAGIVLDKDAKWCLDNLDLSSTGYVIEAIVKHNDTGPLLRLFTQAGGNPSQEKSNATPSDQTSSSSSPAPESQSEMPLTTPSNGSSR